MPTKTRKKYACAICGKWAYPENLTYSAHTGMRYCPLTDAGCARRRKRKEMESPPLD